MLENRGVQDIFCHLGYFVFNKHQDSRKTVLVPQNVRVEHLHVLSMDYAATARNILDFHL